VLPKLKAQAMRATEDPTAIVQKSTQPAATNRDELDSMTNLLVDYVGPIAKNIMVAHDTGNHSASELVTAISLEIPEADEREEFLRRWEKISGTRVDTTHVSKADTTTGGSTIRRYDDEMLAKIGADYAGYIGPLAARLVKHHLNNSNNLEQLVESLANEIPDAKDSRKFRDFWLSS
jgi:hypothetical protein